MRVYSIVALWGVVAILAAATGLLAAAPLPPPAIAFTLTAAILLLLRFWATAREQTRALGPGALVAVHLVRLLAGAYFLVLYRRGVLPGEFALHAGWGDILVGVGAILVLWLCLPVNTLARRRGLLAWNALGLIDILSVLGNGIRLFIYDPAFGEEFTRLPLSLLPTFVVPLVLITHVLIFAWHAGAPVGVAGEGAGALREAARGEATR